MGSSLKSRVFRGGGGTEPARAFKGQTYHPYIHTIYSILYLILHCPPLIRSRSPTDKKHTPAGQSELGVLTTKPHPSLHNDSACKCSCASLQLRWRVIKSTSKNLVRSNNIFYFFSSFSFFKHFLKYFSYFFLFLLLFLFFLPG